MLPEYMTKIDSGMIEDIKNYFYGSKPPQPPKLRLLTNEEIRSKMLKRIPLKPT